MQSFVEGSTSAVILTICSIGWASKVIPIFSWGRRMDAESEGLLKSVLQLKRRLEFGYPIPHSV